MINSIVVRALPVEWVSTPERWPEIARRCNPWLERHESHVPLYVTVGSPG
jgi:hypothetical protein